MHRHLCADIMQEAAEQNGCCKRLLQGHFAGSQQTRSPIQRNTDELIPKTLHEALRAPLIRLAVSSCTY